MEMHVLVVGAGCSICGAVLSDEWLVIKEKQPFIIDEKMLQLLRRGDWSIIKEMLEKVLVDWDIAQEKARQEMMRNGVTTKGEIVPFLITTDGDFIANAVYEKMDEVRRGSDGKQG
jgi:hypothetical protein